MNQKDKPSSGNDRTEYTTKSNRHKNKEATPMLPCKDERLDIMTNINDAAYILFEFYLAQFYKDFSYADVDVQKEFPFWKLRKIAATRLLLEKAGYFRQVPQYDRIGSVQGYHTYLGAKHIKDIKNKRAAAARKLKQSMKGN